jgi:hypothetical protein
VAIFKFCIICDDFRQEVLNKVSILGFFGILDYVEVNVHNPELPLAKLVFMLMSGTPVPKGVYRVRLSLKGPRGNELLTQVDAVQAAQTDAIDAPINVIIACQPLPLAGLGTYQLTVIVNDKPDLSGTIKISQLPSPSS